MLCYRCVDISHCFLIEFVVKVTVDGKTQPALGLGAWTKRSGSCRLPSPHLGATSPPAWPTLMGLPGWWAGQGCARGSGCGESRARCAPPGRCAGMALNSAPAGPSPRMGPRCLSPALPGNGCHPLSLAGACGMRAGIRVLPCNTAGQDADSPYPRLAWLWCIQRATQRIQPSCSRQFLGPRTEVAPLHRGWGGRPVGRRMPGSVSPPGHGTLVWWLVGGGPSSQWAPERAKAQAGPGHPKGLRLPPSIPTPRA